MKNNSHCSFIIKSSILIGIVLIGMLDLFYLSTFIEVPIKAEIKQNPITTEEFRQISEYEKVDTLIEESNLEEVVEQPIIIEPIVTQPVKTYYTPHDVDILSRLVYGEGRGLNKMEMSAIVWVVLNRVDSPLFPNSIYGVIMQPGQFYTHEPNFPIWDNIQELVIDVLNRWSSEKEGVINVGRTLPNDYFFYFGDGQHNYYRKGYRDQVYYDWYLGSPY